MGKNITLIFILLFVAGNLFSKDVKMNAAANKPKEVKQYQFKAYDQEPVSGTESYIPENEANLAKVYKSVIRESVNSTHVLVDSSRNGFGWLNQGIRSVDRFKGVDAFGQDADFMLLGYRQFMTSSSATGILGATTVDVSSGLASGDTWRHVELNQDLLDGTVGARYPGVVALDRPFVSYSQYVSGNATTSPAISHPYLITDNGTYGNYGGAWAPSVQMDAGYQHFGFDENRLWHNSSTIKKDASGTYHFLGSYRNWVLDGESQASEYVLMTAESVDPTQGWTIDTTPTLVDTMDYLIYPTVAMNDNGYGATVGLGHAGNDPDNSFFMSELRIMVMTTTDYGKTWVRQRELSWGELGIPETISASDSIFTDTTDVPYTGEAYLAIPNNHALDVLVADNNDILIAFDMNWGPWADAEQNTYYRNYRHCGPHIAKSTDGGSSFSAHHVAYLNGFFVGDSSLDEAEDNFFLDSELDLSFDENGRVYAVWLDRPSTEIEVAEKKRYNNTNEELLLKADIFAAYSVDGGETWTEKINVSNTKHLDEYELKGASLADSKNNGTVYFGYSTVNPDDEVGQDDPDVYTYRTNRIWAAEANFMGTSIGDQPVESAIADGFKLNQNYPNPFNPNTKIEFVAHQSGQAVLDVYNVAGQKVTQLFNEQVVKGKAYKIDFNAQNISAGIYFYRLQLGVKSAVKKMVLVK